MIYRCFCNETLEEIADGFREENFIGKFQFGKVYRRKFRNKEVTVKVWEEDQTMYKILAGDNESRLIEELTLHDTFRNYKFHPNIAVLVGTALKEGCVAAVYKFNALDTLHNLLVKDNLTWTQRIKVALGCASAIEFLHLHDPPNLSYLIRNICADHIMVDQDHNPILYDFSMISGGHFPDRRNLLNQYVDGCHGYIDPICARPGKWSTKCDVFSYGVLLLELISKKVYTEEDYFSHASPVYEWAKSEHKLKKSSTISSCKSKASLVHHSLEMEPNFYAADGIKITNLAMLCVHSDPQKRPTKKQVVKHLQNLLIFRRHSTVFGIGQMHSSKVASTQIQKISGSAPKLLVKEIDPKSISTYFNREFRSFWKGFLHQMHQKIPKSLKKKSHFVGAGRQFQENEFSMFEVFSYEALGMLTDGFKKENFIGKFQFGKLFYGKINGRKVTVKIWECPEIYPVCPLDNEKKLRDELSLLQHPRLVAHPRVVKLIGYCQEGEHFGIVYDLESLDTLYNLVPKDNFTWLQRMKVAIHFALLLKFLHVGDSQHLPYLVRNIDADHIMLDEEHMPNLVDFGQFTGGILPDRRFIKVQRVRGSYGYLDPQNALTGYWSEKSDVFSYGVVLLSLMSKRIYTEEDRLADRLNVSEWAHSEYEARRLSAGFKKAKLCVVEPSVEADAGFCSSDARKLTKLGMQCVNPEPDGRPCMKQVVKRLLKLRTARLHGRELEIGARVPA